MGRRIVEEDDRVVAHELEEAVLRDEYVAGHCRPIGHQGDDDYCGDGNQTPAIGRISLNAADMRLRYDDMTRTIVDGDANS